MTTSRTLSLSVLLAAGLTSARALAADGWGASYSFNAIEPSDNYMTYMRTTLVPGRLPSLGSAGPLFIWPGISNPKSDLIQTTLNAYANNGNVSYCGATTSQWCAEASVFGSFGQRNGQAVAIDPDDHVTIEYILESDNKTWTQKVTSKKLGKMVSTLQSTGGPMPAGGMGFATEAQNESFTIDTQYYLCTEVHLKKADPTWGSHSGGGNGANHGATGTGSGPGTAKNIHTPDTGLTWLVDLITLPAMNPQGAQTPPPSYDCGSTGVGGSGGASGTGGAGGRDGGGAGGSTSGTGGTGGRSLADAGFGGTGSGGSSGPGRPDAGSASRDASGNGTGGSGVGSDAGLGGSSQNGLTDGSVGNGGAMTGRGGATSGSGGTIAGSGGSMVSGGPGSGGHVSNAGGGSGSAGRAMGGTTSTSSTSPTMTNSTGSSGCSCNLPAPRRSHGGALTLLGCLVAALLHHRRRRQSGGPPRSL
jgi:hypothetical protein